MTTIFLSGKKIRKQNKFRNHEQQAFTIVELLVVIVVIGILAGITIMSYSGIQSKAIAVSLVSDLNSDSKILKLYNVEHGYYPDSIDTSLCPNSPTEDTRYCLKASTGNSLTYTGNGQTFNLTAIHTSGAQYEVTENESPSQISGGGLADTFARTLGGVSFDGADDSIKASDGNYIVVGSTESFGVVSGDAYIAKYSPDGSLLWSRTWGGASHDYASSVANASDGGFVVAGVTESFGSGMHDAFIAKYTSDGTLSWDKTYGGSSYDLFENIKQTSDNGYIAVGLTSKYVNPLIVKYNSSGEVEWSKSYALGYSFESVVQTSDEGYIAVGKNTDTEDDDYDAMIVKFSSSGDVSWARSWGQASYDSASGIIKTTDGGFAITGMMSNYDETISDVYLAKFTSDGILSWSRSWGSADRCDRPNSITQVSDGGYVVVGSTDGFGNGEEYISDLFITKLNIDGTISWNKTWGGINLDEAYSVFADSDKLVVAGYTESYDNTKNATTPGDVLLLKFTANGLIYGCVNPVCQSQTITSVPITPIHNDSLSTTLATFTASAGELTATVTSPSSISIAPTIPNDRPAPVEPE